MRWLVLFLLLPGVALAIPVTIHQEGFITNAQGVPYEGAAQLRFDLYEQEQGGAVLWFEEHNLNLSGGYYSLLLGTQTAFGEAFAADPRFLGVSIDGVELLPRAQLASAPYALTAQDAVGDISPQSVHVGGQQVINETGNWVGPPVPGANDGVGYDTPQAVLTAIKSVDGADSGLDADTLDGIDSAAFLHNDDQVMVLVLAADGVGSGLDVDHLDGHDSSAFIRTAAQLIELLLSTDGTHSGLDADRLDGHDSAELLKAVDPASAVQLLNLLLTVDGQGSGLDLDRLDGHDSSELLNTIDPATAAVLLDLLLTVDGANSDLDVDLVDGHQATTFMRVDQDTGTSGNLSVGGVLSGVNGEFTGTVTVDRVETNTIGANIAQMVPLNAPPENPQRGLFYFSNLNNDIRIYNGDGWEPMGGFKSDDISRLGQGLLVNWDLDQGAQDKSGNNNHGTVTGATHSPNGGLNSTGAYQFDGSDDFVTLSNINGYSAGNTPVTIAAWFNMNNTSGNGIIGIGSTGNRQHFYIRNKCWGEHVQIGVDDGGADQWWESTTIAQTNRWYHVAASYNPNGRVVKLYIDGILQKEVTLSNDLALTDQMRIGGDWYNDNDFNGMIDEVYVYNRVLSDSDVQNLYGMRTQNIDPNIGEPNVQDLLVQWNLNQNTNDQSGNGNDGVVSGAIHSDNAGLDGSGAYQFDGNDDFITLSSINGYNAGNTPVTISAWFNMNNSNGNGIIGVGSTGNRQHFYIRNKCWGNHVQIGVDDGGADQWWESTTEAQINRWYHVVASYNPNGRIVKLYMNGNLQREVVLSDVLALTNQMRIGGDWYNDNDFNGMIDEVRIYGRTLSDEEVYQLYTLR